MKEIIELNDRLRRELGDCFSDGEVILGRDYAPQGLKRLPLTWREEIDGLRTRINHAVPDDFSYRLFLGADKPGFMLEYNDGPSTVSSVGHEWEPVRCLIEQLKELDWMAERERAIAGCQMFDEMRAEAEKSPSGLPHTKQIQKTFREEMRDFIKGKREDASRVQVLMWRHDEGLREEEYDNLESFCRELPDIMTVHYLVITVVAGGKPLPVERIEELKGQAVKELEDMPSSHAKALWKL
jgi:hypothetical protein